RCTRRGERRPTRHTTTSFTSSPASTSSTTTASTTRLANSIAFPGNATAVTPRPPMSMGLPGLFSGYQCTLREDSTGTALYFCMYEVTKSILVPGSANHGVPIQFVHMFSGGFAGTASWLVLFPIDMVKSVIQREALNSSPKYQRGIDFIRHRSFPVHAL
ncbi:mitochondrial carrier domain-containing protein, partial [Chytridium lagenaria]